MFISENSVSNITGLAAETKLKQNSNKTASMVNYSHNTILRVPTRKALISLQMSTITNNLHRYFADYVFSKYHNYLNPSVSICSQYTGPSLVQIERFISAKLFLESILVYWYWTRRNKLQ